MSSPFAGQVVHFLTNLGACVRRACSACAFWSAPSSPSAALLLRFGGADLPIARGRFNEHFPIAIVATIFWRLGASVFLKKAATDLL